MPDALEIRDIEKAITKSCLWQPTSFECVTYLANLPWQDVVCGQCSPKFDCFQWPAKIPVSSIFCRVHMIDAQEWFCGSRLLRVRFGQCERCSAVYYALLGMTVQAPSGIW